MKRKCFQLSVSGSSNQGGNEKMKFTEGYWLPSEKQMHPMQCRLMK